MRTRAERQADGSYKIFGTKIFITYGEHDMAENIVHQVLARVQGAPEGVKGISLFVVLTMRALAYVAAASDLAHHTPDAERRAQHQALYDYLVPVVKGFSTELAVQVSSLGVQVHRGMGFIEETGATQHYRDARILSIYEGTTATQANDLVGRKTLRDGGAMARQLCGWVASTEEDLAVHGEPECALMRAALSPARQALEAVVEHVLAHGKTDPKAVYAGAVNYLLLAGYVLCGWQMARALMVALEKRHEDPAFYEAEVHTTLFHAQSLLPQAHALASAVLNAGADTQASATDTAIAGHVMNLLEDGSTLQLGIGALPNIVGALIAQSDLKDLGVHTEMLADSYVDMYEAGRITGRRKALDRGKMVYTFALGSQKLYDFLHNNPAAAIYPASYTNDPCVIGRNPKVVAINNAIEVDLFSQVSSESTGPRQISGTGGQLDFILGAYKSEGGKGLICLNSTYRRKDGTLASRIVPTLSAGSIVTCPRSVVHYVVTEFGCAQLKAKSTWQRAEALIDIAHPDFRETLIQEAARLGVWRRSQRVL